MKTLLSTTAALLLAGGAFAQTQTGDMQMGAQAYDADQDMQVSRDEFETGMQAQWSQHDADQNDALSQDEFEQAGLGDQERFTQLDENQDMSLSRDEYNQGTFAQYDQDQDEFWNESEFTAYDEEMGGAGMGGSTEGATEGSR